MLLFVEQTEAFDRNLLKGRLVKLQHD